MGEMLVSCKIDNFSNANPTLAHPYVELFSRHLNLEDAIDEMAALRNLEDCRKIYADNFRSVFKKGRYITAKHRLECMKNILIENLRPLKIKEDEIEDENYEIHSSTRPPTLVPAEPEKESLFDTLERSYNELLSYLGSREILELLDDPPIDPDKLYAGVWRLLFCLGEHKFTEDFLELIAKAKRSMSRTVNTNCAQDSPLTRTLHGVIAVLDAPTINGDMRVEIDKQISLVFDNETATWLKEKI